MWKLYKTWESNNPPLEIKEPTQECIQSAGVSTFNKFIKVQSSDNIVIIGPVSTHPKHGDTPEEEAELIKNYIMPIQHY